MNHWTWSHVDTGGINTNYAHGPLPLPHPQRVHSAGTFAQFPDRPSSVTMQKIRAHVAFSFILL